MIYLLTYGYETGIIGLLEGDPNRDLNALSLEFQQEANCPDTQCHRDSFWWYRETSNQYGSELLSYGELFMHWLQTSKGFKQVNWLESNFDWY